MALAFYEELKTQSLKSIVLYQYNTVQKIVIDILELKSIRI